MKLATPLRSSLHGRTAALISAISLLGLFSLAPAGAGEPVQSSADETNKPSIWTTDFDEALREATSSKRLVLVDFTGSDWCGWCIKLDKEVFEMEQFKKEAPQSFVLVKLDFPKKKQLPEGEKVRNEALQKRYNITGFPTVLVLDGSGKIVGKTGYRAGGPAPYLENLNELAQRPALLAKARQADGAGKARMLAAVLDKIDPSEAVETYPEEVEMMIAIDQDNALGLKQKYVAARAKVKLEETLKNLSEKKDTSGMMAAIDSHIEQFQPAGEELAKLLYQKLRLHLMNNDFEKAGAVEAELVKAAPDSQYAKMAPRAIEFARKASTPAGKAMAKLEENLNVLQQNKDFMGMIAAVENHIQENHPEGEDLAKLLFYQVRINLSGSRLENAGAALKELVKTHPESPYTKVALRAVETARKDAETAKAKATEQAPAPESN
jgi:thioredoxin-related protein/outer membrane protein assembly factor BamD (BamD/ComL family)